VANLIELSFVTMLYFSNCVDYKQTMFDRAKYLLWWTNNPARLAFLFVMDKAETEMSWFCYVQ
jgi:hypothetical protein